MLNTFHAVIGYWDVNNQNVGPNERGKFEIVGDGVNLKNNRYFHYNLYYCCVLMSNFA